jgi:RNA polymerase sigma-70 factor (ECF subfamily)
MESALAQLPDELREVLLLQVGEGLSGAQIAEALGIQHGAVRVRLHRARERLRALLEAADTAPGGAS